MSGVWRLAFALILLLLAVGGASAHTPVPTGRTIVDRTDDNRLEHGPAEPIWIRTELAQHGSGGAPARLIHFAQMTDTQLVDEESPARVEFVDKIGPPYEAAYRPQEGLLPMVLAQEVRAVRAEKPELVMVTGDNTGQHAAERSALVHRHPRRRPRQPRLGSPRDLQGPARLRGRAAAIAATTSRIEAVARTARATRRARDSTAAA